MGVVLFDKKSNCCGCGACINICPQAAISMKLDEYGFCFPYINEDKCISCMACKRVCPYQKEEKLNKPKDVYVAVNKHLIQLQHAASGGIFSAIATKVLNEGGIVFGATLDFQDGHAIPKHISIDKIEELYKLQGSKYVQSEIGYSYRDVKGALAEEKTVLFSGTPCQVAGLLCYLGKEYDNLVTIDLICHGVPNAKFLDDYLQTENAKYEKYQIMNYSFRDKRKGWGMNSRIDFIDSERNIKSIYKPARLNSYNTLFLDGYTYRDNCYSCKYAKSDRVGDLTIGDYWGIEEEHPELLKSRRYVEKNGISCILVNTQKGEQLCDGMAKLIRMDISTLDKVKKKNGQLNSPSKQPVDRIYILDLYKNGGYKKIEQFYLKKYKKQIVIHTIYNAIPRGVRLKLKQILKG